MFSVKIFVVFLFHPNHLHLQHGKLKKYSNAKNQLKSNLGPILALK